MNKNEKAAERKSTQANNAQPTTEAPTAQAVYLNTNTALSDNEELILVQIKQGAQNAIIGRELARLTSLPPRKVRRLIQGMRDASIPILSDMEQGGGYYLPADGEEGERELERFIRQQRAQAFRRLKTVSVIMNPQKTDGEINMKSSTLGRIRDELSKLNCTLRDIAFALLNIQKQLTPTLEDGTRLADHVQTLADMAVNQQEQAQEVEHE